MSGPAAVEHAVATAVTHARRRSWCDIKSVMRSSIDRGSSTNVGNVTRCRSMPYLSCLIMLKMMLLGSSSSCSWSAPSVFSMARLTSVDWTLMQKGRKLVASPARHALLLIRRPTSARHCKRDPTPYATGTLRRPLRDPVGTRVGVCVGAVQCTGRAVAAVWKGDADPSLRHQGDQS